MFCNCQIVPIPEQPIKYKSMKVKLPLLLLICFVILAQGSSSFLAAQTMNVGFGLTSSLRKSVRIPIEIHHNLILLPIKINNTFEVNFILDTGSRTTILTEPLLLALAGVKDNGRDIQIQGLGKGEAITARMLEGVRMSMPGVEGNNMQMVVLPPDLISFSEIFGKPVYGIIGYDLFSRFVVEIDYRQKYIQLYEPKHHRNKGKGEVVKISLQRGKPYLPATIITTNNDTVTLQLLLDTGATQALTVFHRNIAPPDKQIDAFLGRGLSGDIMGKLGRVASLSLANFQLTQVITGFPDDASLQFAVNQTNNWDGNLGADALSRFKVTINYPKEELYLVKNKNFNKPFDYDLSGVQLEAKAPNFKHVFVNYVRPNSPADLAGVEVGDQVVSINGELASTATLGELYDRLNNKSEGKIKMRIHRSGKFLTIVFKVQDLL